MELDLSNQKINAKVREHSLAHVPVLAVVGRHEAEQRTVALRRLGGAAQEVLPLDEAVRRLAAEATPPDLTELKAGRGYDSGRQDSRARVAPCLRKLDPQRIQSAKLATAYPVNHDRRRPYQEDQ